MIRHCVFWKLKEYAEGASKTENAGKMIGVLSDLKDSIAELEQLEVGHNFTESPDAYDVGLCALFRDRNGLEIYQMHPAHLRAVEFIRKVRDKRIVVDFEI